MPHEHVAHERVPFHPALISPYTPLIRGAFEIGYIRGLFTLNLIQTY